MTLSTSSSRCKPNTAPGFEALPEATRDSATGEALQTILDLDLDEFVAIEPPRAFGRD
jgi:hypothetical protein